MQNVPSSSAGVNKELVKPVKVGIIDFKKKTCIKRYAF